ncbi:hypothetical protein S83_002841 [Arachis hypogaea]
MSIPYEIDDCNVDIPTPFARWPPPPLQQKRKKKGDKVNAEVRISLSFQFRYLNYPLSLFSCSFFVFWFFPVQLIWGVLGFVYRVIHSSILLLFFHNYLLFFDADDPNFMRFCPILISNHR